MKSQMHPGLTKDSLMSLLVFHRLVSSLITYWLMLSFFFGSFGYSVVLPSLNRYLYLQGNSAEVIQSTLMNNSSGEYIDPRTNGMFLPNGQLYNRDSSFQSHLNSFEATSGMAPLLDNEKEEYIEMNDLLIPELGASSTEKSTEFLNHGEFGDVNEYDQLFNDISVFQGTSTDLSCLSNFTNNTSGQRQQLLYEQFQYQTPENQLNNYMHPSTTLNQFTDNMWFKDDQAALYVQPPQSSSGAFTSQSTGT